MTLLTPKIRFEETLRTLGMTLSGRQLPTLWTSHALISPWTRASFTREVALRTLSSVAVITLSAGRPTFPALKL